MRNLIILLFFFLSTVVYGQAPEQINYQGVARNAVGNVLPNKKITLRISIRDGSGNGTVLYSETRSLTTNNFGLFNLAIGSPGADSYTGSISGIDWSSVAKYIKVEIDTQGGANFSDMGSAQLLSVPYALYSGKSASSIPSGSAGGDLNGSYPDPIIRDAVITNSKLADNSVSTSKVEDGSITGAKLAAGVIPTSLPPNGTAGGDLKGTYPDPAISDGVVTAIKLADAAVINSKLADDAVTTSKVKDSSITMAKLGPDVILGSGLPSGPAGGDLNGTYPNPSITDGAITDTKLADNSVTTSKIVDASVTGVKIAPGVIPTSLPPSGTAGGDLNGTYPNPSISDGVITNTKLADNSVSTSKIVDASVTGVKIAPGVIPTSLPPNGTAGGDLNGTYPNPQVNRIRGVDISSTLPVAGEVLKFDGTQWIPGIDNIGGGGNPTGPAGGDLNGTYPNPSISDGVITNTKLADNSVSTSKIVDASVTGVKIAPGVIPTSLPPSGTAGGDLNGTYPNPLVNRIQGVNVSNTAPAAGQVLKFNGTQWIPDIDNVGSGGNPTGPAGGDLSGTYPNPNLAAMSVTTPKIDNGAVITPKIADAAVTTNKIADLAVTTNKLADNSVTTLKIVDASVTGAKIAPGVIPTTLPPSGAAGGDLNGSYPNPSVNQIQGVSVTTTGAVSGQVLKFDGISWIPGTDNTGGGGSPTGPAGGDLNGTYPNPSISDGVITNTKLADNSVTTSKISDASVTGIKIAPGVIPTTLPPSGSAGGDLAGTYPNPAVGNGVITALKLADNSVTTSKIVDASVTGPKIAPGVIPTTLPPSGAAGGDLAGTYPNPLVNRIQGVSVSNTAPAAGQVLKFDGIQWIPGTDNMGSGGSNPTGPAGGDLTGTYPNPTIGNGVVTTTNLSDNSVTTSKIVDASVTGIKIAPGVIPTTLPPNGAAGGDLTGTYPNPAVGNGAITTIKLSDNSVTTSKIVDASVTGIKIAPGVIPTTLPPNGAAGGDLTGTYPNPSVNKIQGVTVDPTGAVAGQVLKFDGIQWIPGTDDTGGGGGSPTGPAGGDLSGTYPNPAIGSGVINTAKLADNAVTTAKILDASVTGAKIAPGVIPTALPPNGGASGDLSGSYPGPVVSRIQGVTVSNTAPANGQVLKFNGTQWVPGTDNAGGGLTLPYSSSSTNAQSLLGLTNQGTGAGLEGINSSNNANAFGTVGRISSPLAGLSSAGVMGVNNGSSSNGYGVWGSHSSLGTGVYGSSANGNGVQGFSTNGNGIFGSSTNYSAGYFDINNAGNFSDAIYGYTAGSGSGASLVSEIGNGVWGTTFSPFAAGILGYNFGGGEAITGLTNSASSGAVVGKNMGTFAGVEGIAAADNGTGVLALGNADGSVSTNALVAELQGNGAGNPAVFRANGSNVARIDNTGKGYFNGGTQNSGADIAEAFDVSGSFHEYEAGDVLVISVDEDRTVEKSSEPYSTLVAGVYATKPGMLLTEENLDGDLSDKVPMGVIGVIPTKVCSEGGAISRGDLLVTSSIQGVP